MVFFMITKEKVVLEIIEAVNKAAETKKRQYTMNTNIAKYVHLVWLNHRHT
jgi:hypothetical protein